MPRFQNLAERISRRGGNRNRSHNPRFENSERKKGCAGVSDQRLKRFRKLRGLKIRGIDTVMKQRRSDVARLHALIHHGALQKEKHPGRHSRADRCQNQQEYLVAVSIRQRHPRHQCVSHRMPIRSSQNCRWNKEAIEDGETHRDSFPGPITPGRDCTRHNKEGAQHGQGRWYAEKAKTRAHGDEFRNQRQQVANNQIGHGEKAPELPETIEDQFGVTPVRDGT